MKSSFVTAALEFAATLGVAAALSMVAPASPVRAVDAEVGRARALLDGGDAAGALRIVTHIEARTDLPASELVSVLVVRARAHAALGEAVALAAAARMLVALAPSWQAPTDVPEALRAALDEARVAHPTPPEVDVDVYPASNAARIVIEVDDDETGAARGTRLSWRLDGERSWNRSTESEVFVRGLAGTRVEYYAEALGPGGVVIARAGSEATPEYASVPATDDDGTGGLGTMTASSGGSMTTWLVAGGVAVGALILVLVLVATSGSGERTDLGVPIVEWP